MIIKQSKQSNNNKSLKNKIKRIFFQNGPKLP